MHWTLDDVYTLPLEVYEVLVDELAKESDRMAHAAQTRTVTPHRRRR